MEIRLERLGPNFKKQQHPACRVCEYDADWILKMDDQTWMFCERDLINALLDTINFNVAIPSSL